MPLLCGQRVHVTILPPYVLLCLQVASGVEQQWDVLAVLLKDVGRMACLVGAQQACSFTRFWGENGYMDTFATQQWHCPSG